MSDREALQRWVDKYLATEQTGDGAPVKLEPITGDAGFRQYFRVDSTPSTIAVYAPPSLENNVAFVAIDLALRHAGVRAPRILAVDYEHGFMLQEDLGAKLYSGLLCCESPELLLDTAVDTLLKIQQMPHDEAIFPPYSAKMLLKELELFPEWFVGGLLEQRLSTDQRQLLRKCFAQLVDNALEQPQVVVHRDFHSRNLLALEDGDVGVIDFQDAVIGPVSYDLVSLLRDRYVYWPEALISRGLVDYLTRARALGIVESGVSEQQFRRWFDLMGLQRHIKVLGIFARLWLRDGKRGYLELLPIMIRYTLEIASSYQEYSNFFHWFETTLSQPLQRQDWYRNWQTAGDL